MTDQQDPVALAVQALVESDARLATLIERVGPCLLSPVEHEPSGHFAGLAKAIVSQQLSSKAADAIFARLEALASDAAFLSPGQLLAIPEATLRSVGLSSAKAGSLRDLATRVHDGSIRLDVLGQLSDDKVIATLCQVKGIGRWTAEMFLIFRLARLDVLPVHDLGVQKGFQKLFALRKRPSPDRMKILARAFCPYRSVACWYLWRIADLGEVKSTSNSPE